MNIGYKLVDFRDGQYYFLYHGVSNSMKIPFNKWIKADKKIVSDGKGTKYLSGFHYFEKVDNAINYIDRFTTRKSNKRIIKIIVDDTWKKEHSKSQVSLAGEIMFLGEIKII